MNLAKLMTVRVDGGSHDQLGTIRKHQIKVIHISYFLERIIEEKVPNHGKSFCQYSC